jgi:hypothetical protein
MRPLRLLFAALCLAAALPALDLDQPLDPQAPSAPEPEAVAIEAPAAPGLEHGKLLLGRPETLGEGHMQARFSYSHLTALRVADEQWNLRDANAKTNEARLEYRYGVWPALDVALEAGLGRRFVQSEYADADGTWQSGPREGGGLSDTLAGFQWQAYRRPGVCASWSSMVSVPTGTPEHGDYYLGMGAGATRWQNRLSAAYDLGDLALQAGVGYEWPLSDNRGADRGLLSAGLAAGVQLHERFQPSLELAYAHGYLDNATGWDRLSLVPQASWTVGWGFKAQAGVSFDLLARNAYHGSGIELGIEYLY